MAEGEKEPAEKDEQEPIPKLPRGRFFSKLTLLDLFRIGLFAILLVAVLMMRKPCADGVANLFDMLAGPPDAGPELRYERLTDEELRERLGAPPPGRDAGAAAPGDASAPR